MITNDEDDPSHYLSFRISSAYQKWNELKHVFTDKIIYMSTRVKLLEACVRSRLLYSCQSWDLYASEIRKLESIWHGFLRRMKAKKEAQKSGLDVPEPQGLDWAYVLNNENLRSITKTIVL